MSKKIASVQTEYGKIELKLGHIYRWNGELVELICYTDNPTVSFKPIMEQKCPNCGKVLGRRQFDVVIDCRNMKEYLTPVNIDIDEENKSKDSAC